jgi:hypothetical protein
MRAVSVVKQIPFKGILLYEISMVKTNCFDLKNQHVREQRLRTKNLITPSKEPRLAQVACSSAAAHCSILGKFY